MQNPQDVLKQRPAVHVLYRGCYLQAPLALQGGVTVIPLKPAEPYLIGYFRDYLGTIGVPFDEDGLSNAANCVDSRSVGVVIAIPIDLWTTVDDVCDKMADSIARIENVLSWATGNQLSRIGSVVLGPTLEETYCNIDTLTGDRRMRLGLGNTGSDFDGMLNRLISCHRDDEQLRFALSMAHNATMERDIQFRIARYYNCLESLANNLKTEYEKKHGHSSDAIRKLIGIVKVDNALSKTGETVIDGRKFEYDSILVGRVMRNHLYHGEIFCPSPKNYEKDSFDLLGLHPAIIEDSLRSYCEIELARWANGKSNGYLKETIS